MLNYAAGCLKILKGLAVLKALVALQVKKDLEHWKTATHESVERL